MKSTPTSARAGNEPAPDVRRDRRGLVVGTGIAGVAAVAAHALHRGGVAAPAAEASAKPVAEGEGYRLTPHIRRYYETTKA